MTLENRLPEPAERDAAAQLRQILSTAGGNTTDDVVAFVDATGTATPLTLPPALLELMDNLLEHLHDGCAVRLEPVTQWLTAHQAAGILNVSLRHFKGLMQRGDISHERVGRHQRIKARDLFEYKKNRDATRSTALDTLAEYDTDLL